jgi:pimeloyl-ACP methyl ester carboxylesterase
LKIIERFDKLSKEELEYIISGCVIYNKISHENVDVLKLDIKNLSKIEIINLIGYSLFGLDIKDINSSKKYIIILKLIKKIESKLGYSFNTSKIDRYLYRTWGSNFIKFSFRPLILQIPLKIIITSIHILFTFFLGFKWQQINKIGFLSKDFDPNKKNIIFIHGLGFGYIPYFQMLMELNKKYNLIILVLPNISSYNYYDDINYAYFPPLSLISNTLYDFLESKNISSIILLAHSFGTYITQFLRKDDRSIIFSKIILVDPIIFWIGCFKMSLHIENPFIKKYPIIIYFIDNLINFMIYQCLYLKYVCFRVMFGPDFWIYDASELYEHKNIVIILQKNDYIIPAELIYDKIKNYVKCYYFNSDEFTHGTILMEKKYTPKLIEIIDT